MKIPRVLSMTFAMMRADAAKKKHKEECDCDDPECALPIGRCFLCGNPTHKANRWSDPRERIEFTVCWRCKPVARMAVRIIKITIRASGIADECCECRHGVLLMNDCGPVEIQRCDTCNVFESDQEAATVLAEAIGIKPPYPDGA